MPGDSLAHYRHLEKIGAGGMGVVYRARDTRLGRSVALKVVGDRAGIDQAARDRLLREARTASALNHPNICTIYEVGEAEGETYIAMELIEGQTLSGLLASGLPTATVLGYAAQIGEALAHAHDRGVVHRDLKSANVIVTPDCRAKVLDFGLARRIAPNSGDTTQTNQTLTRDGTVAGTLAYMPPEVLRGEIADARGDLWALGVILYESLAGRLPFDGATAFEVTSAILRDPPPALPSSVPHALAAIVLRLLAKDPAARYQRAQDVVASLESARLASAPPARSRRRWIVAVAAGLLLAAVALFALLSKRDAAAPLTSAALLSDGSRASSKPEANESYERAMLFVPRHDPSQVRRNLERALEIDPHFAAARGNHAFTSMLYFMQGDTNDTTALYKAEEEARQALRDDPECGVAHSTLAGVFLSQGRKELVPAEIAAALKGNNRDPAILLWAVLHRQSNGEVQQAIDGARQILVRTPFFWPARLNLGEMLAEHGELPASIHEYERLLEQDPQNRIALAGLAHVHMLAGDVPRAREALDRIASTERHNYRLRLHWALLFALEKRRAEALSEMDEGVLTYAGAINIAPLYVAEFYSVLGDHPKALDWLDRAVRLGDSRDEWMRRNPLLAGLRDEPRFQQIVSSIGYRRQAGAPR